MGQARRDEAGHRGWKTAHFHAPSHVATLYPHFFWDGRAASREEQALAPIASPIEMGNTHQGMIATLLGIPSYKPYFREAFGTEEITKERVAKAIADSERTRLSANSPWDKWKKNKEEGVVSDEAKKGDALFFGKAECNQCHLGQNFADSLFHDLGIGWDAEAQTFKDEGRAMVSKMKEDIGACKTPGLRSWELNESRTGPDSASPIGWYPSRRRGTLEGRVSCGC